jgi:CHAP domain
MHTSNTTTLLAWIGGIAGFCLAALLLLASASASLAWMSGAGAGPCLATTPAAGGTGTGTVTPTRLSASTPSASSSPAASPTVGGGQGSCFPASGAGAAVVQWAKAMANALYVNPSCGGTISFPTCYYTWYNSQFPQAVIQYGQQVCPGCSSWANGSYQCVSFVRGAYSQVYPMTLSANAFDLWATYSGQPGWTEVPSASAPPSARGIPEPGDVMVFKDSSVGHVSIVMAVSPPVGGANGSVQFANANSVSPYTTMPLLPDLTVDTSSWPGYTVWGYIRPHTNASQALTRIAQLDPGQYDATAEYDSWAYSACSAAAMTEVLNAYGRHYRIHDILAVEAARGDITPQLGLVSPGGIADTVAQFGFQTPTWGSSLSLDQVIASANAGTPVIVGFPPDRYAGGHILVVTGGTAATVVVADSSAHNYTSLARGQFLQWWGGFSAIVIP